MPLCQAVGVALLLIVLSACNRAPTVYVENTSGERQRVWLTTDRDVLVNDSLPPGSTRCFGLPEWARRRRASLLVISMRELNSRGLYGLPQYALPWEDSLLLDGGWRVHIHAEKSVNASPTWRARRDSGLADAESSISRVNRTYTQNGLPPISFEEADAIRSAGAAVAANPGSREAPRYEPKVEITPSRRCSGGS
jgi:hypothetical protein